jgi:hypothetical protein
MVNSDTRPRPTAQEKYGMRVRHTTLAQYADYGPGRHGAVTRP